MLFSPGASVLACARVNTRVNRLAAMVQVRRLEPFRGIILYCHVERSETSQKVALEPI